MLNVAAAVKALELWSRGLRGDADDTTVVTSNNIRRRSIATLSCAMMNIIATYPFAHAHTLNSRVGASDTTRAAIAGWAKVLSKNVARMRVRALRLQQHQHPGVNSQRVRFYASSLLELLLVDLVHSTTTRSASLVSRICSMSSLHPEVIVNVRYTTSRCFLTLTRAPLSTPAR